MTVYDKGAYGRTPQNGFATETNKGFTIVWADGTKTINMPKVIFSDLYGV